jgi:PAS domain S-box-containing protein
MPTHGAKSRRRTRGTGQWLDVPVSVKRRPPGRLPGLRRAEEPPSLHRLMTEHLPEIVWTATARGANDFCNLQWTAYTGLSPQETQGDGWLDAVHPDDVDDVITWWKGCVEGTGVPVMRYRLRSAEGKYRWYLVRATAMRGATGEVVRWVGNLIDIHDQVTTETQLKVSDARYRDLVEMSQDAIYIRCDGKFVFANAATARLFGVESPSALAGKSPLDFVHPDFVSGLKRRWVDLEKARLPLPPYQLKLVRRDGSLLDVESIASPIEFEGRPAAHVVVRDISERKALQNKQVDLIYEQAAHAQAAALADHFRLMAEAVPNIVWTTRPDGHLDYVNKRTLDFMGCRFEDIEGWGWRNYVHPDDIPGVETRWRGSLASGSPFEVEERFLHRDGTYRWQLARGLPVRNEGGSIIRWVGSCVDIDDQKHAQTVLKNSRTRLEAAVMLRTQELVQANSALRASEEKLRNLSAHLQSAREAERTSIAREIHDELGASLTAVKMDLTRYMRNSGDIPPTSRDLLAGVAALVDSSIQTLRRIATQLRPSILDHLGLWPALEWQLEEFENRYGVQCSIEFNAMPTGLAKDAQTALFRIVQEALTNVARHSQATRVRVSIDEIAGHAAIDISDNGVGIPANKLSHPASCGILGMHERAEAFGGRIRVESTSGSGTRLSISFPLAELRKFSVANEVA